MWNGKNFARPTDNLIAQADAQPTAEELAEMGAAFDAMEAALPMPQPTRDMAGVVMGMDIVPDINRYRPF
jgi:hypothetical protein